MRRDLEAVLGAVQQSKKYRHIDPGLIRRIAQQELQKDPHLKSAIKGTKNKLHQVAAAYQQSAPRYENWLADLRASDDLPATCRDIMQCHASTRERLAILPEFYERIFAAIGEDVHSLLDVACGLNPLAVPWMPLAPGASYMACDLFSDMMAFVGAALPRLGVGQAQAFVADIGAGLAAPAVDVALVLKTLPVLEQVEKGSAARLLKDLASVNYLVISYPAASLGGRKKGMAAHYEAQFLDLIAQLGGQILERLLFESEIVFLATIQSP